MGIASSLLADMLIIATVCGGGRLIGRAVGTGASFYCEPLVPWGVGIAMGGGFGVAWVASRAHRHGYAWAAYPLALLGLLRIAPFYGFFVGPLVLGLSLNTMCSGRSLPGVVLIALGMRVGEKVGLAVAKWSSGAPRDGASDRPIMKG